MMSKTYRVTVRLKNKYFYGTPTHPRRTTNLRYRGHNESVVIAKAQRYCEQNYGLNASEYTLEAKESHEQDTKDATS